MLKTFIGKNSKKFDQLKKLQNKISLSLCALINTSKKKPTSITAIFAELSSTFKQKMSFFSTCF